MASEAAARAETGDFANMVTLAGLAAASQAAAASKDSKAKAIEGLPSMNKTLFKRVASTNAFEANNGLPGGIIMDGSYEAPATRTSAADTTAEGLMREQSGISFKDQAQA